MKFPSAEEAIAHRTLHLMKRRFVAEQTISEACLQDARFRIEDVFEMAAKRCIFELLVPGKETKQEYTRQVDESFEEVPLTWWDHAKDALNRRFGRKYKVSTRRIRIENIHETRITWIKVCPHLNLVSESNHLRYMMRDDDWPGLKQ